MNLQSLFHNDGAGEIAEDRASEAADRRRHKRIAINALGRFMRADKSEHTCRLIDVSIGGAAMHASETVAEGEHIIAYFDEIGRIDGPVARVFEGGFAIRILATAHRREKLCAQLMWLANRRTLGIPDGRRHDRIVPSNAEGQLQLPDGSTVACRILDVSISGASLAMASPPPVGMEVMLGRLRAKVVREHESGVGLRFLDIQNPTALRRHFG